MFATDTNTPQAGTPAKKEVLTEPEAAQFLTVEPRTLRLWRNTRSLPFVRISAKAIRYRRADLESWLASRRIVIAP